MAAREAFIEKMQARLDEVHREIGELTAKGSHIDAAAYAQYTHYLADCRQRREELLLALTKYRECRDDSLEDMKLSLETAGEILAQALDSVRGKFR